MFTEIGQIGLNIGSNHAQIICKNQEEIPRTLNRKIGGQKTNCRPYWIYEEGPALSQGEVDTYVYESCKTLKTTRKHQ